MARLGRPLILAGFGVAFAAGIALVVVGGRESERGRFIDDAAAVCTESKARVQDATDALLGAEPSREEIEVFLAGAFADELRDRLERLRSLDVPDGEAEEFGALVDGYAAVVEAVAADPAAAAAGDDPFADVDAAFDDYGLEECGSASAS